MALIFEKVLVQRPRPVLHITIVNPIFFLELLRGDVARYTVYTASLVQDINNPNNLETMSRL